MQGLVLLDKPSGITSFGAVAAVRKALSEKRAGHTGTLDPFATGVLPILFGRATRLSSFLLDADKRYTAKLRLGIATDTLDITGTVTERSDKRVTEAEFCAALDAFRGKIMQVPPMYSAIRKDGVRMHQLARSGVEVEREARQVEIKKLDFTGCEDGDFIIDVICSKGTYIRSLADDIGRALGCFACVSELRRTATSGFGIDECVTLEEFKKDPAAHVLSAQECVSHLPVAEVTHAQAVRVLNGGALYLDRVKFSAEPVDMVRINFGGEFLALGKINRGAGQLDVVCVIYEGDVPIENV